MACWQGVCRLLCSFCRLRAPKALPSRRLSSFGQSFQLVFGLELAKEPIQKRLGDTWRPSVLTP